MDIFQEVFGKNNILNQSIDFLINSVSLFFQSSEFIFRVFKIFVDLAIWSMYHFTIALAIIEIFIIGISVSRYHGRPIEIIRGYVEYNVLFARSIYNLTMAMFDTMVSAITSFVDMIPFV